MAKDENKTKVKAEKAEESKEEVVMEVSHEECEVKLVEMEGKYRRAIADYANLERQVGEEQRRFVKVATQIFVEQMITPFDHLQLAAGHLKDKGLDMVVGQFRQLFESQGLKEIEVMGKLFDAAKMEAVGTKEGKEDEVVEVMAAGWELNGVVIRPAKVVVGKGK